MDDHARKRLLVTMGMVLRQNVVILIALIFVARVIADQAPTAHAKTIRARRASNGAVRARCAIDSSVCRCSSVTTSVAWDAPSSASGPVYDQRLTVIYMTSGTGH